MPMFSDIVCCMKMIAKAMAVSGWSVAAAAFAQTAPVVMHIQSDQALDYYQPGGWEKRSLAAIGGSWSVCIKFKMDGPKSRNLDLPVVG